MTNIINFPKASSPKKYLTEGNGLCFAEYPIGGDMYYRPINERAKIITDIAGYAYLPPSSIAKIRKLGLMVQLYDQNVDDKVGA